MSSDDGDDPVPWWQTKNARRRVRAKVGRVVANEKARQDFINGQAMENERRRLAKHFARFDPPQDDSSLRKRLLGISDDAVTDTEPDGDDG